jgi:N6-L-threonylcarbamoyladenine synthase
MKDVLILSIESSCDETSAAVLRGQEVLSNVIATQKIHEKFGGVVPELASRAHQVNILPVVHQALEEANCNIKDIKCIACTSGPGLLGALLVGVSFAKSLSLALNIPLVLVDHMQAHVLAHFIHRSNDEISNAKFPMLCLTVSGGHTQLVEVNAPLDMRVIGKTIDDAAGEAFDKAAKVLGLPYPGGPLVDKYAQEGNPNRFQFTIPETPHLSYSFSGLKTSLLYFLKKEVAANPDFISENLSDICASYQNTIVTYLLKKVQKALDESNYSSMSLAGGVSANSLLRKRFLELGVKNNIEVFIPSFEFTTDNAAMIGGAGFFKYQAGQFSPLDEAPNPRASIM